MSTRVLIVAGEASADKAAAGLVGELRKLIPRPHIFGVGGKQLAKQGMEVIVPAEKLNVVGIADWFDKAKDVIVSYRKLSQAIEKQRPDVAVLVDLPDLNLRLAKKLKKMQVPVVYYISPQIWAWRKNRIKIIKDRIDEMLVVFPFEAEIYKAHGIPVKFVGHPLLDSLVPRKRYRDQAIIQKSPRIAILPGSRKSELRYHAPVLKELIKKIAEVYPNAQIQVPVADTLSVETVKDRLKITPQQISTNSWATLDWADLAVVASGTATLETALIGTPFCTFYKVSASSAWIFKKMIKYKGFIAMPNILLGRAVVKEFFQESAKSENIFAEITRLLNSGPARLNMVSALLNCRKILGESGANREAANRIFQKIPKNPV